MSGKVFRTIVLILFCILIAVLLAIFLFGFMRGFSLKYIIKKLVPGTVEGVYKAVDIHRHDGYEGFTAYTDGEKIYMLEGSELAVYERTDENVSYIPLGFTEPAVAEGEGRLLAYDMATGDFKIIAGGKIKAEGSVDGKVLGGNLPDKEHIGFILASGNGFRGSYIVLDGNLDIAAEYSYSDRYPVSGCISPDGRHIAVAGIPENNADSTKIDVFLKGEKEPDSGRLMEMLSPLLVTFGKDSFAACGSEAITVISFEGSSSESTKPGDILFVKGTSEGLLVVCSDTGKDVLSLIGTDGSILWSSDIPAGTSGLAYTGEHIFCWNNTEADAFFRNGKEIDIQGETGPVKAVLPLDEYTVAIVTDSDIIFYEFN